MNTGSNYWTGYWCSESDGHKMDELLDSRNVPFHDSTEIVEQEAIKVYSLKTVFSSLKLDKICEDRVMNACYYMLRSDIDLLSKCLNRFCTIKQMRQFSNTHGSLQSLDNTFICYESLTKNSF